jgi:hypothetical protein
MTENEIDWSAGACVARGVAFLDSVLLETWDERIKLYSLNMSSSCECVCGFVFNDEAEQVGYDSGYDYALLAYGKNFNVVILEEFQTSPVTRKVGRRYAWAAYHGFDAPRAYGATYDDLHAEWKRVIIERRSAKLVIEREAVHA